MIGWLRCGSGRVLLLRSAMSGVGQGAEMQLKE